MNNNDLLALIRDFLTKDDQNAKYALADVMEEAGMQDAVNVLRKPQSQLFTVLIADEDTILDHYVVRSQTPRQVVDCVTNTWTSGPNEDSSFTITVFPYKDQKEGLLQTIQPFFTYNVWFDGNGWYVLPRS